MDTVSERKLLTILAADVVGYSAMMGRDEVGTLQKLKECRETMTAEIARCRGRVFNSAGDGLLAEFGSVVNAVDCAVGIQRRLAERNATLPENDRMRLRIGINLGDVLVEEDDLFGDGVNIAARLQALAEPGGILVSGAVFEQVRNKLSLGFDPLGSRSVKNIAEPVPVWRVVLDGAGATTDPHRTSTRPTALAAPGGSYPLGRLGRHAAISAVLIVFLFAINLLGESRTLWAHWPALAILLVLGLRAAGLIGKRSDP